MSSQVGRVVAEIATHEPAAARAIAEVTHGAGATGESIIGMFQASVGKFAERNAFMYKPAEGEWAHMTFREAGERVEHLGEGLIQAGVKPGEKVSILANSRVEWGLVDYASLGSGAVVVPIYQNNVADQVLHVLKDSGAAHIIVEDAEQYAKVESVRAQLPELRNIFIMDPSPAAPGARALSEIEELGRNATSGAWKEQAARVKTDDLATIIYTSGTTGNPKGSLLTNRNYTAITDAFTGVDNLFSPDDRVVQFLPLAHTFARSVNFAGAKFGMEVAYSTPKTILSDLKQIQPTIMPSVPRIFEKANAGIIEKVAAKSGTERRVGEWGLKIAHRVADTKEAGKKVGPVLGAKHAVAEKLVYSKIRAEAFGGRLENAYSGGAKLDRGLQAFMDAIGIKIHDAYGMTETPAISMNMPGASKAGSVGKVLPGVEVRIGEGDEILVRGDQVFKGYHNNPEATAATIDADGWLHTGDQGKLDEEGFLYITGRIKDLIKTSGGKYVQPAAFESLMKANPNVGNAVLYGDGKNFITAMVTLNEEHVAAWAKAKGIEGDIPVLAKRDDVQQLVADAIADYNKGVDPPEQVKKFRVLDSDLSLDLGEITPTLKVKRNVVSERFAAELDAMYAEGAPDRGAFSRAASAPAA